jgi:hypothetical protein
MILISVTATLYICTQSLKSTCLSHHFCHMVHYRKNQYRQKIFLLERHEIIIDFSYYTHEFESQSIYFYTASSMRKTLRLWLQSDHDDSEYITFMRFIAPMAKRQQGDCDNNENVTFICLTLPILMRCQWDFDSSWIMMTMSKKTSCTYKMSSCKLCNTILCM